MHANRFDALSRALTPASSRRSVLQQLGSGLLAATALATLRNDGAGKKKGERKRKGPSPKFAGGCQIEPSGTVGRINNARLAQSFVAERSGELREIRVAVEKEPGTVGNWVVQLVPVLGGNPAFQPNWVFAAAAIDDGDVPVGLSTLVARFVGISILEGFGYAVVVTRSGGGAFKARFKTAACDGGIGWEASDVGAFSSFIDDFDFAMSIFVV